MERSQSDGRRDALMDLSILAFGLILLAAALACFITGEWVLGAFDLLLGYVVVDRAIERMHG